MANTTIKKKSRSLKTNSASPLLDKVSAAYDDFRRGNVKFVGVDGASRNLPGSLNSFLSELNKSLKRGKAVTIVRNQATFTSAEAADLLKVSRQFLVNLLEKGEIPFYMVGTHRRIYAQDLFRYKTARDKRRHAIIRDLAVAEMKEGIYDLVPLPVDGG
jgi:excisionase family DNA binding protein